MPGLALLSPIFEVDEFSPYRANFSYARYPGQKSPIGSKSPSYNARDTPATKFPPDVSMDDLWIYDCYISEDMPSPLPYSHSPSTPTHNRSISLPASTANYIPPNNIPLIKEPNSSHLAPPEPTAPPRRPLPQEPMLDFDDDPAEILAYSGIDVDSIDASLYNSAEFPEYSPLEQEVMSVWEVMDQLASAANDFSGVESVLSYAASYPERPFDVDDDVVFWFIEALNLLAGDCTEVAKDLMRFGQHVEELLVKGQERVFPNMATLPRASFSEQDMQEVLVSAASIPQREVAEALAALEASVPLTSSGKRRPRDRPPSLKLSTDDAVLLQARLPRARLQSVEATDRFTGNGQPESKDALLRKHRGYVIIGDETPIDDNTSSKSFVDFDGVLSPVGDSQSPLQSPAPSPRPRIPPGQTVIPRPLSSPLLFGGKGAKKPPSLVFSDSASPKSPSSRYTSSSVSSLFSGLPRSSFTASSPRSSPRQSFTFDRFPASTGNIKKMFSNIFKKKEREGSWPSRPSLPRPFGRRTASEAGTGSIDATLSALALSGMSSGSPTSIPHDPFAPSSSLSSPLHPVSPVSDTDMSALSGYSSMFNPLKAASRYPSQPLFGGVEKTP